MSFGPISLPSSGGGTDDQTAAEVPYTPGTPGNWPLGAPSDVEDALEGSSTLLFGLYNVATATFQDEGAVLVANGDDTATWTTAWPEVSLGGQSTGNIAASGGTADVDFALPTGVTRFLITEFVITRTAGTGTSASASVFSDDARSLNEQVVFGSSFGGITVDPGPVYGPRVELGADQVRMPIPYRNTEADEFVRLEVTNQDVGNDATYSVTIRGIPLRAFP